MHPVPKRYEAQVQIGGRFVSLAPRRTRQTVQPQLEPDSRPDHSLAAALIASSLVSLFALAALMRFQDSAWKRASAEPLIADEGEGPS
jgi:hypothetical protein